MREVLIARVHFPPDGHDLTLATGVDLAASREIRVVVPPEEVLGVLAALHDGKQPVIEIHDFDVADWTGWWQEV